MIAVRTSWFLSDPSRCDQGSWNDRDDLHLGATDQRRIVVDGDGIRGRGERTDRRGVYPLLIGLLGPDTMGPDSQAGGAGPIVSLL